MRVVVTGATGNVGPSVVEALRRDPAVDSVVGLARRLPELQLAKVQWVRPTSLATSWSSKCGVPTSSCTWRGPSSPPTTSMHSKDGVATAPLEPGYGSRENNAPWR